MGSANIVKDIPFAAYQGINQVYCTASVTGGINNKINTSVTDNSKVTVTFVKNTDLGNTSTMQGTLSITLFAYPDSSHTTNGDRLGQQTFIYTWVKNTQGEDGRNAVLFQLYTPNGYTVTDDEDDIIISPLLMEGSIDKTSVASYTWAKYVTEGTSSSYVNITNENDHTTIYISGNNLVIPPDAINSYLSIRCIADYTPTGSATVAHYTAYQSVYDKTDLYQTEVFCTLGDKIVNSQGVGIIYTKVLKNGEDFDPIKSTAVSTTNSATAFNEAVAATGVTGSDSTNYCWLASSNSLTLYHKNGTTWSAVTAANDPHLATYTWTGTHIADNTLTTIYGFGKNKAILVNGNIVNKKTMFNVTMTAD